MFRWQSALLAVMLVGLATAGCPRLPPAVPRPHAAVESIERLPGALIELRITVEGADGFAVEAIDYEIYTPDGQVFRGRGSSLRIVTGYPAELARAIETGGELEIRGAVHLRSAKATAMASFSSVQLL